MKKVLIQMLCFVAILSQSKAVAAKEETRLNLILAMQGEAFAYLKYLLFAEEAARTGQTQLADLFTRVANEEKNEHFVELAQLRKLVGSSRENLNNAIAGEKYEAEQLYPEYAKAARAVGDTDAANRFEEIAKDEAKHQKLFEEALEFFR